MKPIPTTNAMKPAPGKGVSSFPTPVIKDTVIVEIVNAWKGDYTPLEYGTKWDDVPHASVQGSFPDHKLINQSPNSEDGQFVKRIWANDRVDQDTYNYAIKYSGGSDAHPIYIRAYVELRETYAPVPDLSPDPLFPNALLVEEEVQRQEDELDSRYVKVIRTYETLPGPIISSQRVNERGDLETVEVQEVAPSTPPDPDGLFVTQTQVIKEDVSKGTKTTATVPSYSQLLIKEKKEGLLGETITTDDIVDPATNPDALSQSVISSAVQQTSATKAVKRTTTASGPTSLTKKSRDGKLLGNVTQVQSVVAPDASPDNPSNSILASEVNQVDSGKAIKTNVILESTPTLLGGQTGEGLLGTRTTTESIVPAGASADAVSTTVITSQVEPIDSARSRKVTTSSSGPTTLGGRTINDFGASEVVTKSIVPAGQAVDLTGMVVSDQVAPIDSAKSERERRELLAMPDNFDYYETISQDKIVVRNTVQILRRNDPLNPIPVPVLSSTTLDVQDTPLQFPWIRRVTKTIPNNLPPSRIEWDTITYTFPGIIYSWKARLQDNEVKANLAFFDNRYPVSMTVASKHVITYHNAEQDLSNLEFFKVTTRPWARIYFGIPDNTIHPPAPITLTGQSVERGGVAFDIAGGQASDPTFYVPGDEILIGAESKLWWSGIYVKRLIYVKEPI